MDTRDDHAAATEQLRVFRNAAALLSSTLELDQTLANVVSACLPALGDFGFFDMMLDDGVRRTARAHRDPETEAILVATHWVRQERADMNLCALSTGQPALHLDIDDAWYRKVALSDAHLDLLRRLAFRSMLTVPLRFGHELVGALTLFMGKSGRSHAEADLAFAQELASLAAPVVVNVRLLARQRMAEAALRASEERLRLLDAISQATRTAASATAVMEVTTRLLGEHMGVARCAYADLEPDNDHFTIIDDWTAAGVASTAGKYSLDQFGTRAAASMRAGRTLVIRDMDEELPPEEGGGTFSAIGIKAIICCPLVKEGRLAAMMAVHHASPRQWTGDDIMLVEEVVERSWAHIERVHATEALRRSEGHLLSLFEQTAAGIAEADLTGRLITANDRYCQILGRRREDVIGRFMQDMTHPDDLPANMALFGNMVRTGESFEIEKRYLRPDGSSVWASVTVNLIRVPGEQASGTALAVVLDIGQRKQAEEKLKEADRLKDEFLAMLAHELRNPLAPISAAADLLQIGTLDAAHIAKTSEIIARQVHHLTDLVDDLLDVSRVTRGLATLDKVEVDIKRKVADAVEQVRPLIEARRHRLDVRMPPESAFALADRKRVVQIMVNLLNNAAKYTPEGGHIVLALEVCGDTIELSVSDNGIGMTPGLVERAFELFAQAERSADRSQGGLGIGLALVRSLVELHGGTVHAESAGLGKGSRFIVRLPRLQTNDGDDTLPQAAPTHARAARALTVLVVDDNRDAAFMLGMFLQAMGHDVFIEHAPAKAIERARQLSPDVCLLDIGLPDMDGNALVRHLRSMPETAGAVMVAVTGYGQEHDRKTALDAGFDHHFVKPVDTEVLARLLQALSERGME